MLVGDLDIAGITASWQPRRLRRAIAHFDELPSTNAYLLERARQENVDGVIVVAEYQHGGRGRQGRRWQCPRGAGILCTVGLTDSLHSLQPGILSLIVPVALCDAIHNSTGVHCTIEWPNDLTHEGRKLAGILIEAQALGTEVTYALGFGINCLQHRGHFPEEFRERATSLDLASTAPVNRSMVLAAALRELDGWLANPAAWNTDRVRRAWLARAPGLGRRVRVAHDGGSWTGNVVDIDPTAAIVIQLDEGGRRMFDAAGTSLEWVD